MLDFRSRARRIRRLARRLWVDGRLPPTVGQLYRDVWTLRVRAVRELVLSQVRSAVGIRIAGGWVVRDGGRRWHVTGRIDRPLYRHGLDNAVAVEKALAQVSVDSFLVDVEGDRVVLGVAAPDRTRAWQGLHGLPDVDEWVVEWWRGPAHGFESLARRRPSRRLLGAREWRAMRPLEIAPGAVSGPNEGVEISFWEAGELGRMERVGVRGHERLDAASPATVELVGGHSFVGRRAAPVSTDIDRFVEPVDVVVTWVDGDDPAWREQFAATASMSSGHAPDALHEARFSSRDELRSVLRSIWLYAGWVRRVHVVTSGQVPAWLREDDDLRVVSHAEIFPDEWLPTFNSHAIESRLHHIDGLAEHFVYFNDDVFLGRSLSPRAFFTSNGLPKILPAAARIPDGSTQRLMAMDTAAQNVRKLIERDLGRTIVRKLQHAPFALRRTVLTEIEQRYADEFARTGASRFRHADDVSVASMLAPYYAFATGQAVNGDLRTDYVHLESGRLSLHLERLIRSRAFDTFCLNETETPGDPDEITRMLDSFLAQYFPTPSPWEAPDIARDAR